MYHPAPHNHRRERALSAKRAVTGVAAGTSTSIWRRRGKRGIVGSQHSVIVDR